MAVDTARIRPRALELDFDDVPVHWLWGRAFPSAIVNGVNLLFPAGERFFIRSVLHYRDQIDDPKLAAQIRAFCGQESHHAHAHEQFFDRMRQQGFAIDRFLRIYERLAFHGIEPSVPPSLRLAVTAALEHYTAILGDDALREGHLRHAHPVMRDFLSWHAAEEIEHKSVAFDVLERVAPGYALRASGMVIATLCLAGFWVAATAMLLHQDRQVSRGGLLGELRQLRKRNFIVKRVFLRGLGEYLWPGFHPLQKDNLELARSYLASVGLA